MSRGGGLELCCESHPCSVTVRMARPLEQAVAAIVCTFQEYAGRCGDKYKLCQAELKELLQKELATWTPVSSWSVCPLLAQWEALPRLCQERPGDKHEHRTARGGGWFVRRKWEGRTDIAETSASSSIKWDDNHHTCCLAGLLRGLSESTMKNA